MYSNSSTKFGHLKSWTVWQRVNGLVVPPSWVEVINVIPLYEVSRGLNLNLCSVGGRSLKLTDYYRAEARRYLPVRAKTKAETMRQSRGWGSKVETEARPCEAERGKKTAARLPRAEANASRTTSLLFEWNSLELQSAEVSELVGLAVCCWLVCVGACSCKRPCVCTLLYVCVFNVYSFTW